jgi:hypothetical protein
MKFSVAFLSLLASLAVASPGARNAEAGDLAARADCKHCGCSSTESCTFDCCQ